MKMIYTTPEMKMVNLEAADVLTLSVMKDRPVSFGDDAIRIEF